MKYIAIIVSAVSVLSVAAFEASNMAPANPTVSQQTIGPGETFSGFTLSEPKQTGLVIPDTQSNDVLSAELTDAECLALNIYFEARSESMAGQEAVAQTTVNRMVFRDKSACGVVRQYKQFSWTHDGESDQPEERAAYESAYKMAVKFLYTPYYVSGLECVSNYHADYVDPNWDNLDYVGQVETHLLYERRDCTERLSGFVHGVNAV